jgi:hypothetical protein
MKLTLPATRNFLLAISIAFLAACGGGDGVGSGGTGIIASSGVQTGTISGFGSIIIEGNKYDDSIAVVSADIEPGNLTPTALPSLKLGMQINASFDSNERVTTATVLPAILGKVASVNLNSNGDTLIVAGQTVRLQSANAISTAPTVFEGITGAKDVVVGAKLEVHGYFDTDGSVIATRVELLDERNTATRISGVVSALGTTSSGQSFKVASLQVNLPSTAKTLPASSVLKNGDRVTVWSAGNAVANAATTTNTIQSLTANVVRIDIASSLPSNSQPWRIAGPIGSIDINARTLMIDGISINFMNATLKNTQTGDLQKGAVVRVKGNGSNAIELELLKTPDKVRIELAGVITDFNSAMSFKVRNSLVNASATNIVFVNGTMANLSDGVLVEIEGSVINGVVVPSSLKFKTSEDSRTLAFLGQVSNYNASTGLFNILGAQGRITNTTIFKTFSGGNTTVASFINGVAAQVKGSFAQGVFFVTEVRLGASVVREVKMEGIATNVNFISNSFTLNGIVVNWTTATDFDLPTFLKDGVRVVVEGLSDSNANGVVAALKIQVKDK